MYADIIFLEGKNVPSKIPLPEVVGEKLMLHQLEVRCYQWKFSNVNNVLKTLQKNLWRVGNITDVTTLQELKKRHAEPIAACLQKCLD